MTFRLFLGIAWVVAAYGCGIVAAYQSLCAELERRGSPRDGREYLFGVLWIVLVPVFIIRAFFGTAVTVAANDIELSNRRRNV